MSGADAHTFRSSAGTLTICLQALCLRLTTLEPMVLLLLLLLPLPRPLLPLLLAMLEPVLRPREGSWPKSPCYDEMLL